MADAIQSAAQIYAEYVAVLITEIRNSQCSMFSELVKLGHGTPLW